MALKEMFTNVTKISKSEDGRYINLLNFYDEGHRDAVYEQVKKFLIERDGERQRKADAKRRKR